MCWVRVALMLGGATAARARDSGVVKCSIPVSRAMVAVIDHWARRVLGALRGESSL